MRYLQLVELYGQLERTPAKLKKTSLIADILKKTPSKLLPKVVLLVMGKVRPAYSQGEMGVANQLMIKAIAKAFGAQEREINRHFTKSGDLGTTAEHFSGKKKQRTLGSRELDIEHVFTQIEIC